MEKCKNGLRAQDLNPGPTACEASMLPQDQQVRYKFLRKIKVHNHMWREIQSDYVELERRSILMVKNKMASVQDTCPCL